MAGDAVGCHSPSSLRFLRHHLLWLDNAEEGAVDVRQVRFPTLSVLLLDAPFVGNGRLGKLGRRSPSSAHNSLSWAQCAPPIAVVVMVVVMIIIRTINSCDRNKAATVTKVQYILLSDTTEADLKFPESKKLGSIQ